MTRSCNLFLRAMILLAGILTATPALLAQTLLQVEYPFNEGLFQKGQTYTINLTADPSVQNIYILTQSPLPAAQPTSSPTQFTLILPTNIPPGLYSIGAVRRKDHRLATTTCVPSDLVFKTGH